MRPVAAKPELKPCFDRVERLVGAPLEDLVATKQFADLVVAAYRAQVSGYRLLERSTRSVLHLVNIPTRSDVMRLSRQIASLENSVRSMILALERADQHVPGARDEPHPEHHRDA